MEGLYQCEANYVPLSPISFLERASFVYENRISVVYDDITYTWKETRDRCVKLASALSILGVKRQEVVVALAPNIPALYELHFAVPMVGAVLSALNTRLDPPTLANTLEQLQPRIIFVDYEYIKTILEALKLLSWEKAAPPSVVLITGKKCTTVPSNTFHYNDLISLGNSDFKIIHPKDECDPISISYTSGSTGNPKGVVYSHRAAYLNSLAVIFRNDMKKMPVFLWTIDMFRCNGWCFPWAMAALGGTNICLRELTTKLIFDSIVIHKVTHLFGAPAILEKIANSQTSEQKEIVIKVDVIIAGPLPPVELLSKIKMLGFNIDHGYGMTEALGPMMFRSLEMEGEDVSQNNDNDEYLKIKRREGTYNLLMEDVDVKDPETMKSVPSDGKAIGEVMFRGNIVMSGYLKNFERTQKVFKSGWYRTGDLGIKNPNGDIEMKDRALDSIIVDEEIVSTIEIEQVILSHPLVKEVAVVGKPDDILGEAPCAFVTLKNNCTLSSHNIIKYCEEKLMHKNMIPKNIYFGILPMNSTGKILKFVLREKAKGHPECSL